MMNIPGPYMPVAPAQLAQQPQEALELPPLERRRGRALGLLSFLQSCRSALRALRANKLRSLLTSLGIIIGVGAVILMVSISEGNDASINSRLSTLSPNELTIFSGSTRGAGGVNSGAGSSGSLTQADADAIGQVAHVAAASPVLSANGQVIFSNQNWSTSVQGVYPSYQQISNRQMQEGAYFSQNDEQSANTVAVIGQTVEDNLFTPLGVDPIGQQIRIGSVPFTVIGVLASEGTAGQSNADDIIYVPFSTAQQRLTVGQNIRSIYVMVDNTANVNTAQIAIQQLLEQRHGIFNSQQDDFSILNQSQLLQTVQSTQQSLTTLLVSVAAISLLVGGIGIMNIMLVSVTERTREIGIRIAIGARPPDVMVQFLIEALVLSALGGIAGIVLGVAGAYIDATFSSTPFVLDPLAMLLAFGFSALVGVAFGFYPAQRAARLDPIVALRTE
jgi:putative ABC transport system permease protein